MHCEVLGPSVGYCKARGYKIEMKYSYCVEYYEERGEADV